jgi:pimeloyl-ACP methyl ester carboxylesterase
MNLAIAVPINSTIVRSGNGIVPLLRAYFAIASRLIPNVARRQAERLFTQPPRYAGRAAITSDARRDTVVAGTHSLAVWQSGPVAAPAVLLVHGWGGRGAQMASFVSPLLARGYRVVWFDQPGHGDSSGSNVALPDFARAIEAVARSHGPFVAAVGHSVGAAALGLALRAGLALDRVVFVSAPSSLTEHAHNFARMLGIPPSIRDAMRGHLECRYGIRFSEIDRIDGLARLRLPALFVHDRDDREVPYAHALRLSERMRDARLTTTYGFGHRRLLREPSVVQAVVDFVAGNADDVPAELPVLPRPAPLY